MTEQTPGWDMVERGREPVQCPGTLTGQHPKCPLPPVAHPAHTVHPDWIRDEEPTPERGADAWMHEDDRSCRLMRVGSGGKGWVYHDERRNLQACDRDHGDRPDDGCLTDDVLALGRLYGIEAVVETAARLWPHTVRGVAFPPADAERFAANSVTLADEATRSVEILRTCPRCKSDDRLMIPRRCTHSWHRQAYGDAGTWMRRQAPEGMTWLEPAECHGNGAFCSNCSPRSSNRPYAPEHDPRPRTPLWQEPPNRTPMGAEHEARRGGDQTPRVLDPTYLSAGPIPRDDFRITRDDFRRLVEDPPADAPRVDTFDRPSGRFTNDPPVHVHDVSCSFGNPTCPAYGERGKIAGVGGVHPVPMRGWGRVEEWLNRHGMHRLAKMVGRHDERGLGR